MPVYRAEHELPLVEARTKAPPRESVERTKAHAGARCEPPSAAPRSA
jgi:hypothetical protein